MPILGCTPSSNSLILQECRILCILHSFMYHAFCYGVKCSPQITTFLSEEAIVNVFVVGREIFLKSNPLAEDP